MRAFRVVILFLLVFLILRQTSALVETAGERRRVLSAPAEPAAEAREARPPARELPPQEPQDFGTRCQAPGVLVCQGFDSSHVIVPAKAPASGLYPAEDVVFRGTFDPAIKASGNGSLRFEIPTRTGANGAGFWRQAFGRSFGRESTFYVQFRQRFSKEMLKNNWGDTTWKQVIFHNGPSTCDDVELTTVQYYHDGFPTMYTKCGARTLYTNGGNPPTKLEQGDYNCWYGQYNARDCFMYPANAWVTFYYEVSIGHWGLPDSTINAWVALDGRPYKQWIQMRNFVLDNDHPGTDYDTLTLLPYMTAKSNKLDLPTAYTWYDDLIVSTTPIAPPIASTQTAVARSEALGETPMENPASIARRAVVQHQRCRRRTSVPSLMSRSLDGNLFTIW
jgi:hypothetical protein